MLRLLIAISLGCASAAWAAPPAALTTLHAIHALSHAEASTGPPVAFEATVTYWRGQQKSMFVEDAGEGLHVRADSNIKLAAGDRVLVHGSVQDSFRPIVAADSVTLLHHGVLPQPVPATFDQLIRSELDGMRVTVRAVVRSKDVRFSSGRTATQIHLLMDGGTLDVWVEGDDPNPLQDLIDNEVEVTGVASAKFDGKMKHVGVGLDVLSFADIKILKSAELSPWALPVTSMDEILNTYHVKTLTQRVRVQGTVTYYQPGTALVLQNGANSLWIMTHYEKPIRVGDQADVTGFATLHDEYLAIASAEIKESPVYSPIVPLPTTGRELASSKHIFDLVSIEGQVVMEVRENSRDEYVLVSDGQVFSAVYRPPSAAGLLPPPMNRIPLGSRVRVSGICIPLDNSRPFNHEVPFDVLMRTPDDIGILAKPSLLTVRNLIYLVGLLLAVVLVVGARGWTIEHRVRRQTAALAYIEQRRSRILEDINGSRPLVEIVEEITELVSFKLRGSPCWCRIADGAQFGNCPRKLTSLRVVQVELPVHAGKPIGTMFAAFDVLTKPSASESEALSMAAGLAALAIETRRLYKDLLRRSEFDLLTDIHNRFSLEKRLEAQIEEAGLKASVFGLIYIDLDKFKQVNDIYGHLIGDLYLQEVALRMKRQLRNVDMLARIGGDEFAALVPVVRNRADVDEIALRLERCFDEPFAVGEFLLYGAASVGIAVYPEDAATADSLVSAADAAMYAAKHGKRQIEQMLRGNQCGEFTPAGGSPVG